MIIETMFVYDVYMLHNFMVNIYYLIRELLK